MLALLTLFSDEFEVSLRSMMSVRRDGTRRHTVHNTTAITRVARQKTTIRRVEEIDLFRCWVSISAALGEEEPLTGAMKRYPRRASVSMNTGTSADSPSASRNLLIAVFRPVSKSTKVSPGQSLLRNSSRATTSPGRSTKVATTWNACSWSITFLPAWGNAQPWKFTSNLPKRTIDDAELADMGSFQVAEV